MTQTQDQTRRLIHVLISALVIGLLMASLHALAPARMLSAARASTCNQTDPNWANRDESGSGVCNGVSVCPFEYDPVNASGNQDPSLCAPKVVVPPARPQDTSAPHLTYSGATLTLTGIARYLRGGERYRWDFGDGTTPTAWTPVTNVWELSVAHVYSGAVGREFAAQLELADSSGRQISQATFLVEIARSQDLTAASDMDVRAAMAVDHGLWYLHHNLSHQWSGPVGASEPLAYEGYGALTDTCVAIDALERAGHLPNLDPAVDPYVQDVRAGLNWIVEQAQVIPISNRFGLANPDVNGNGIGIRLGADDTGQDGVCAMALIDSRAPGRIAWTGPSQVFGRSYAAIAQDLVDWFSYSQTSSGGWWYNAGYSSSGGIMTTSVWPLRVFAAATRYMGATVPAGVQTAALGFLRSLQDSGSGAFGWNSPTDLPSVLLTSEGLFGLASLGTAASSAPAQAALGYIAQHWSDDSGQNFGGNLDNYTAMESVSETLSSLGIDPLTLGGSGSFDWFYTPAGQAQTGYSRVLTSQQDVNGSWSTLAGRQAPETDDNVSTFPDIPTSTALAVETLTTHGTAAPVHAGICHPGTVWDVNSPITLDATCSTGYGLSYQWTLNGALQTDPTTGRSPTTSFTTSVPHYTEYADGSPTGTVYEACLTVSDAQHDQSTQCINLAVRPGPSCPVATAGGPYRANAGQAISLDASGSTDRDGDPLTYAWDVHNDGAFSDGTGPRLTTTFTAPGTYVVAVQVTSHPELAATPHNDTGMPGAVPPNGDCPQTAYTTVVVGDARPQANVGGPYVAIPNGTITLDGTGSTDPNGQSLTYAWDLTGSGLTDSTAARPQFTAGGTPGKVYPVCVTVFSAGGRSVPACTTVTVINAPTPPVCTISTPSVSVSATGGPLSIPLDGSRSSDRNGAALTYHWTTNLANASFDHVASATPSLKLSTSNGLGASASGSATLTVDNGFLQSSCDARVTILDNLPPVFTTTPAAQRIEAGPNATTQIARWLGSAAAADPANPGTPVTVSNDFTSNGPFGVPVGASVAVTWTAANPFVPAATRQVSALLTVVDTTPPTLSLPADITVPATGASGAPVSFTAAAHDLVSGATPVVCAPASGATFPVGTTQVHCTSTDGAGNTANGSFAVTVTPFHASAPSCTLTAVRRAGALGHDQGDVTITAPGGLSAVTNVQVTNGSVTVPLFPAGTTQPVIVTATKATQGQTTHFSFDIRLIDGSTHHCE